MSLPENSRHLRFWKQLLDHPDFFAIPSSQKAIIQGYFEKVADPSTPPDVLEEVARKAENAVNRAKQAGFLKDFSIPRDECVDAAQAKNARIDPALPRPVVNAEAEADPELANVDAPADRSTEREAEAPLEADLVADTEDPDVDCSDIDAMTIPPPSRPVHPLAAQLPMMAPPLICQMATRARINGGIDEAGTLDGETILDGRNRDVACQMARVPAKWVQWDRKGSAADFILAKNNLRRHQTPEDLALFAAAVKKQLEVEARARREANLRQNKGSTEGSNLTHRCEGRSIELAAEKTGLRPARVKKAAKLSENGHPELVEAYRRKELTLNAAAKLANRAHPDQCRILQEERAKKAANAARAAKPNNAKKDRPAKKPPAVAATASVSTLGADDSQELNGASSSSSVVDIDAAAGAATRDIEHGHIVNSPGPSVAALPTTAAVTDPVTGEKATNEMEINFQLALRDLLLHARKGGAPVARSVIEAVAKEAGLNVWIGGDNVWQNLDALAALMGDQLCNAAGENLDEAIRWSNWIATTLATVLAEFNPSNNNANVDVPTVPYDDMV